MLRQFLIDYSHDVINNRGIVACRKHKWACMRFLRDIEREGTSEFPYIFDEDKAIRFFDWMGLFKHTKGVLKGRNIEPHEIQYFVFGNIYGWVHKDSGYRRFRKAYWQVGRKNAKSQSLACVASYESMAMEEMMSEVYIGATKTEQAKIVWNETEVMLYNCSDLKGRFEVKYGKIYHPRTRSFIKPLSKEDRKTGDGTNPQCGIIDEYHAHDTDEIYNVIDSGMGARTQPLLMVITTAGSNLNSPCYRIEYDFVGKLLDPDNSVELETYFAMVNELDKDEEGNLIDNIDDESVWEKANPILCSYPEGRAFIKNRLDEARLKPEMMDDYLTKNMNVWINQGEKSYMRMDKWAGCGVDELPDLLRAEVYVGIDLSKKIDLTSVGFEFFVGDKYVILSHSFIPEDTLKEKIATDKVPYALWVRNGWITVTPGAVVDYRFVQKYIKNQVEKNGWKVKEVCYDDWSAGLISQEMLEDGYEMVEIRQGIHTLSEPTKNFREEVYAGNVIHDKNPVLTWAIGNAVTRQDHNENIMLDKNKSTNRIDPIAAVINAHVRAMVKEPDFVYNDRGLEFL
jgi:phage terminase large subunit-like protein